MQTAELTGTVEFLFQRSHIPTQTGDSEGEVRELVRRLKETVRLLTGISDITPASDALLPVWPRAGDVTARHPAAHDLSHTRH